MSPKKFDDGDRSEWMPRSEAAKLFDVSVRTMQRWAHRWGNRQLRTMVVPRGKQRITLMNRADVERLHKTRFGRPPHEVDAEVMAALRRGDSPEVIVREHRVSLDELEQVRTRFLRLTDARLLEGPTVRLICEALESTSFDPSLIVGALRALRQIRRLMDVGDADHATLVVAVQTLLERHSRLVAERRASDVRAVIKPMDPAANEDGITHDRKSSAGNSG